MLTAGCPDTLRRPVDTTPSSRAGDTRGTDVHRPSTIPGSNHASETRGPLITGPASAGSTGDANATQSAPNNTATTRPNAGPHWSRTTCRDCHEFKGPKPQHVPVARIETLCLECHDGRQASVERHPVGRVFADERITKPEDWPAPGGRLTCFTCHEFGKRHATLKERPSENPAFVRGYTGGGLLAFCARCHVNTESHAARAARRASAPGAVE